jgi:post-segregation antitoxin (ccd killing protein)
MEFYSEQITLKISLVQKETLNKLRVRNIRVSDFIRKAISEKLKRDADELKPKPIKIKIPF